MREVARSPGGYGLAPLARRHVMAKTKTEVTAKVRKLEKLRDQGNVPKAGRYRVGEWLSY